MKVICIDGVKEGHVGINGSEADKSEEIYEGEIYTVLSSEKIQGKLAYKLEERPPWTGYFAYRFAPLSSIDETEFERNYKKELV